MIKKLLVACLALLFSVETSNAMLQVRNAGSSSARFSAELNIGGVHPMTQFTYIYRVKYRIDRAAECAPAPGCFQTPLAVGYGHGFDFGQRYIVGFDGSGTTSHRWAIGDDGRDTYGADVPEIGRWYCQAIRRRSAGGGVFEQIFFYDIETDINKIAQQDTTKNNSWSASTWIVFGAVPWTDFEGMDGAIENAWLFNTSLTTTQIVNQCTTGTLADPTLTSNVFAHWPMISDGNDASGFGWHLSLNGGANEAWFDGTSEIGQADIIPPDPPSNVRAQ